MGWQVAPWEVCEKLPQHSSPGGQLDALEQSNDAPLVHCPCGVHTSLRL
jgi:hypothetical protein